MSRYSLPLFTAVFAIGVGLPAAARDPAPVDALVYTPGDNEWTDCHRSNNGKYDPLERLAALRNGFFLFPNVTLGGRQLPLFTQADHDGLPEHQTSLY